MSEKQIAARKRYKQMQEQRIQAAQRIADSKRIYRNRRNAALQREYYRTKHGVPLDAPVLNPAECAANARKARQEKKEAKP